MKNSNKHFLFSAVAIAAFASAALASTLSQKAADELSAARAEYSQIVKTNETNAAAVRAKLDALYAEISATETAIENASRESANLDALALADSRAESVSKGLAAAARGLRGFDSRAASAFEVYTSLEPALQNALDSLANPLKMRSVTATDPKSGAEYSGNTFRVGGFSYFVSPSVAGFLTPDNAVYGTQYAAEIRDFSESKTRKIPADISGGKLFKTEKSATSIREQIELGGVWIYPILFLGALSCATALAKILTFARAHSAKKAASRGGKLPPEYADILRRAQNCADPQQKQSAVYDAVLRYNLRLNRGKSALSVSAAVAPLFGLLGTVSGIIKTFSDLATSHSAQTDAVSDGIAEALITTEYGLIVAIPALVAAALVSRAAKFYSDFLGDFAATRISADPATDPTSKPNKSA